MKQVNTLSEANLFVISAPSGTGKTSLVRVLVEELTGVTISISHTTRAKRMGDQEGIDYFFINETRFQAMKKENSFLEYATIYGRNYGTEKSWVFQQLKDGKDVLLEIDWQGARQIRQLFPPALSIFILPPSMRALQKRLMKRRQNEAITQQRFASAREEIAHYVEFDYIIVNDSFDQAVQSLAHIISAKRLQRVVQEKKLSQLLVKLVRK